MKIHPLGAKLFHADGQTDVMKLIDASRSFANMPKNRGNVSGKHYSVNLPVDMSCNEQSVHVRVFVEWSNSHSGLQSFKNDQKAVMRTQCPDVV
jgi:UDP-galactopyranose mutase